MIKKEAYRQAIKRRLTFGHQTSHLIPLVRASFISCMAIGHPVAAIVLQQAQGYRAAPTGIVIVYDDRLD